MKFESKRVYLKARKQSYHDVFKGPSSELVTDDLRRFCRADETTFHPDPRVEGILQGRREVWLRIQNHLNLSPDDLVALYDPEGVTTGED